MGGITPQIALLRGINVGGHKKVAMAKLRGLLADLGFTDVQSLLQTGNLVFRGGSSTGAGLERLLEIEAEKRLELRTSFVVRTGEELEAVIARNPFGEAAESDPSHLVAPRSDWSDLKRSIGLDSCPGQVAPGKGRVRWNEAHRPTLDRSAGWFTHLAPGAGTIRELEVSVTVPGQLHAAGQARMIRMRKTE